jgi:LysM repeat protein
MKHHPTFPTKRQPLRNSVMKRLFANIPGRKQRVAATANPADFETELPSRKIGNALAVIVAVHVAAAGLVFFHHWRLEGKGGDAEVKPSAAILPSTTLHSPGNTSPVPRLAIGDQGHMVSAGETYTLIAEKLGVEESDLRVANNNDPIQSGLVLKIPPKKIVAMDPPEVAELRANAPTYDRGIVEIPRALPVMEQPQLIRPSSQKVTEHSAVPRTAERTVVALPKPAEKLAISTPKPAASGRSYTVQSGDNFWRIASKYKVDPSQLMKSNGISDAKKLKIGMNLVIPN